MSDSFSYEDASARPSGAFSYEDAGAKPTSEKPKGPGAIRKAGDLAVGLVGGAVGATKALTDVAGAGNAASNFLDSANKDIDSLLSPQAQADKQEQAAIMKEAEGKGTYEGVKAGLKAFAVAPVQTTMSGLGSVIPVAAATLATGGGAIPAMAAGAATGAAMGAGTVKGAIYDDIKERSLAAGMTPEAAEAEATKAQSYGGGNTDQIALGAGLGMLDAATGVTPIVANMARKAVGREAVQALTTNTGKGLLRRTATGALEEMPLEATQGGQEQLAANLAAQRAGFQAGTWDNVASNAALEGLASAGPGAGFGALAGKGPAPVQPPPVEPPAADQGVLQLGHNPEAGTHTVFPDGSIVLNSDTSNGAKTVRDMQRANRLANAANPFFGDPAPAKPSEAMGLEPTAGPSLANASILSVDTGLHQAATAEADPYNAPLSALGQELSKTNQRLRQEADALGLDTEGLHGDAARMTDGKPHEDYLMAANDQLRKAMKAAKEIPDEGQRGYSDDPARGGETKGPDAQAGKAPAWNAAGQVGAGAVRPSVDRVGEHGQRTAGADGGNLPGAVASQSEAPKFSLDHFEWNPKKLSDAYSMEQLNTLYKEVQDQFSNKVVGGGPVDERGMATKEPLNPVGTKMHDSLKKAIGIVYEKNKAAGGATNAASTQAAPTRDQAIAKASDAAGKVLASGGTDADANRAATDSLIDQMATTPGIAIAQDAPAAVKAAKAQPPANNNAQTTTSAPASPAAGLPASGSAPVQAAGMTPAQFRKLPEEVRNANRDLANLDDKVSEIQSYVPINPKSIQKQNEELYRLTTVKNRLIELGATQEGADLVKLTAKGTTANVPQPAQPGTQASQAPGAQGAAPAGTAVGSIDDAAHQAATSPNNALAQPTDGQKKAGNYAKGHVNLNGLDLSIENPAGSERSGTDKDGKAWKNTLKHHYGYIKGTVGNDKDHVDLFVKPETPLDYSGTVFVIDQHHPHNGKFDEHKVMVGFANQADAKKAYFANYAKGWKGMSAITPMTFDAFKAWVKDGAKNTPVSKDPAVSTQPQGATSEPQADQAQQAEAQRPQEPAAAADPVSKYTAPGEKLHSEWGGYEAPTFSPTPRQQVVMDAVARALDKGVFYSDDMTEKVAADLGVVGEELSKNTINTQGGNFGMDVYYARKAVEAQRGNQKIRGIADAMNLKVGEVIGTLITQDFKQTTGVKITAISESGLGFTIEGKRGAATATGTMGADAIKNAIDRAKEKGRRKDGYAEFIAARTAPVAPATANPKIKEAPDKKNEADAEPVAARTATEHAGLKIYPTKVKVGAAVVDMWGVQTPDNARREKNGERQIGGDPLSETLDGAKKNAEAEVRDAKSRAEREAESKAADDAAQAKKDANKGKSILQRRADALLDKQHTYPPQAGLGQGTRREAMQKSVDQGRAIVERMVPDTAAKHRDQTAIDLVKARGYILGLSNENIPVVKQGLEAQARMKANQYEKPEYRVYDSAETDGGFYEITKTEFDYAKSLTEKAKDPHENYIKSAADSIARLRKSDVYRVLDSLAKDNIDGVTREGLADYIKKNHPDYAQEVDDVLTELSQPTPATPVHQDPGAAPEAATAPVIAESLQKAAKKEERPLAEMKAELLGMIDAAVKETPNYKDYLDAVEKFGKDAAEQMYARKDRPMGSDTVEGKGSITFDVPGDGKFRVTNSFTGLSVFRAKIAKASGNGFSETKRPGLPASTSVKKGSTNQISAIESMLEDGDLQAAKDYMEAVGIGTDGLSKATLARMEQLEALGDKAQEELYTRIDPEWQYSVDRGSRRATLTRTIGKDVYRANVMGSTKNDAPDDFKSATYGISKNGEKDKPGSAPTFHDALVAVQTSLDKLADKSESQDAPTSKAKDTGWSMAGTGYAGKRYSGRNMTLEDGREVVARIYENAGVYEEAEVKVDGKRVFAVTDRNDAQGKADDFIKTLTGERDESVEAFKSWYNRSGHEIYPSKKAALAKWMKDGIEGLYDMPGDADPTPYLKDWLADDKGTPAELNLMGFTKTPTGNGTFTLSDSNMRVTVEPTGTGFQARMGSGTSGPRLTEQQAVEWAATMRDESIRIQKAEAKAKPEVSKTGKLPVFPVDAYRLERFYANGAKIKPLPARTFSLQEVQSITDWFKSIGWSVTSGSGGNGINATNDIGMTIDDLPEPYTAAQRKKDEALLASDERAAAKKKEQEGYLTSTAAGKFVAGMFGDAMNRSNQVALAKVLSGDEKTFAGLFSNSAADVLSEAGISAEGREIKDVIRDIKAMFDTAPTSTAKEPWQMTEAEFGEVERQKALANVKYDLERAKNGSLKPFVSGDKSKPALVRRLTAEVAQIESTKPEGYAGDHLAQINKALREGKPVPEVNLKRYDIAAPKAEQSIANQTFDQWVRQNYEDNEYKASYLRKANGNEKEAMLRAATGWTDADAKPSDMLKEARRKYFSELTDQPREASISLEVFDALSPAMQPEAQRHFYDLDSRLTRRTQDETSARVKAENAAKKPYEDALAEVSAEIARLDKISGPETQKQKDLSGRRARLEEAIWQIGQGKEPDGRLLKKDAPAQEPASRVMRREPTQVSMFNPYQDGDVVSINGEDWTVKQETTGWYLTNTGNWRGTHPTIRNIKAMSDLIGEVERAAVATQDPATPEQKAPANTGLTYPLAPAGTRYEETSTPITMMTPDAYLAEVRPLDIDEASRDNIDDLKAHILSGKTLDPLHIRADGKEDGRHRAVAAKELGIAQVPVVDARASKAEPSKIENFGVELPPARRTIARQLSESLSNDDIARLPLSQVWPASEIDAIDDPFVAAAASVMREVIPAKPRTAYKVKAWAEKVQLLRSTTAKLVAGTVTRERFIQEMKDTYALRNLFSKIKLLEKIDRTQWSRIGDVQEWPDATKYVDGKSVPVPQVSLVIDDRRHDLQGSGDIATHMDAIAALLAGDAKEKRMAFEIRGSGTSFFINKTGDKQYRHLMEFTSAKDARDALESRYKDVVAAWEAVKERDNITERDLRSEVNRERAGRDWRNGKDVTAEEFQQQFGFRGGEFGKWVAQGKGAQERQFTLNSAYDALMDLADILGIPPRAISLEGTLGIAFGSRGSGWASAHFEPSNLVINLTKPRGAGALAHEWFHALDNYFARKRNDGQETPIRAGIGSQQEYRSSNYITHRTTPMMVRKDGSGSRVTKERLAAWRKSDQGRSADLDASNWIEDPRHKQGVRAEVEERFENLVKALNESPMSKRARLLDGIKEGGDGYWSRTLERAARSFENYIQSQMLANGYHNDFLANVREAAETKKSLERYPYLMPSEIAPIADAFAGLFETVQTQETEDGNVAMFSRGTPFYSELSRQIEAANINAAPGFGWKATLKGLMAKGVKADEITWSGIEEWLDLQTGKVTKAAVLEYLAANGVQVEEVTLGESKSGVDEWEVVRNGPEDYDVVDGAGDVVEAGFLARSTAQEFIDSEAKKDGTKYSQYQLPGGERYREVLLTLPNKSGTPMREALEAKYGLYGRSLWLAATQEERAIVDKEASGMKVAGQNGYVSSHWDQQNVLAHIRVNDRVDADGKRVLFVEEIQSDWGQAGKKQGFNKKFTASDISLKKIGTAWEAKNNVTGETIGAFVGAESEAMTQALNRANAAELGLSGMIPSAPFVDKTDKWLTLSLKRIIKMAVDGGYDRVAFVNGEQSADRYDLSKQVKSIEYMRNPSDGTYKVMVLGLDGQGAIWSKARATLQELEDHVGKEIAQKMERYEGRDLGIREVNYERSLSGDGLKVGGEGMKAFYDQIVPNATKALLKKLGGGQMETVKFGAGGPTYDEIQTMLEDFDKYPAGSQQRAALRRQQEAAPDTEHDGIKGTQPGFTITPAMQEKASGGLPLFRRQLAKFSRGAQKQANNAVQSTVDKLTADWQNKPEIVIAFDMQDEAIPDNVRLEDAKQRSGGAFGNPEGFYYRGVVYLLSSQLATDADIARVLAHESLGHYGLRGLYGKALKPILQQIATMRRADVIAVARQRGLVKVDGNNRPIVDVKTATNAQVWAAMTDSHKSQSAEEVLAEMAQTTPQAGFVKRAVAAIRQWLREHGVNLKLTDNDIIVNYILPARGWVERGPGGGGPKGGVSFARGAKSGDAENTRYTRQWYDRLVSLLPDSYRNDPYRREPLPAEGRDVQQAREVQDKIDALNKQIRGPRDTKGHGPVTRDELGNLTVDAREATYSEIIGEIKDLADEIGYGVTVTGVQRGLIEKFRQAGFESEISLAAIADRITGARAEISDEKSAYAVQALGTIMSYKPRGFPMVLFSRADQTMTDKFKAWFGGSKVVDAQGKPLVVYHGTRGDFNVFNTQHPDGIQRHYFAADPATAAEYANDHTGRTGEGGNVMPAYLAIRNPAIIEADGSSFAGVQLSGVPAQIIDALPPEAVRRGYSTLSTIARVAESLGHDGLIVRNVRDGAGPYGEQNPGDVYIAFRPEQIKSAIGNNGQFDPANADIRFSRRFSSLKGSRPTSSYVDATPRQQATLDAIDDGPDGTKYDLLPAKESLSVAADAQFTDWELDKGIKYIPVDMLGTLPGYDNAKDAARIKRLADAIKESNEIEPIFVGIDPSGEAFIMEGQHRARAFKLLGEQHIPAQVVVSMEGTADDYAAPKENAPISPTDYRSAPGQIPMFSRVATARDLTQKASEAVRVFTNTPGKVNWWHKTVGTQYNLAQRSPEFKRVYDAVQDFIGDVSFYATEAADLAPKILPKLDTWRDIAKSPVSGEDTKAIAAPIFEGTLVWARDESGRPVKVKQLEDEAALMSSDRKAQRLLRNDKISEGVLKMWRGLPMEQYEALIDGKYEKEMLKGGLVWSDAELKSMFNLTGENGPDGKWTGQIGLYHEFRASTDKSLTNLAISDMLYFGGKDVAPIKEAVLDAKTVDEAAEMLRDYLMSLANDELSSGVDMGSLKAALDEARGLNEQADAIEAGAGGRSSKVVRALESEISAKSDLAVSRGKAGDMPGADKIMAEVAKLEKQLESAKRSANGYAFIKAKELREKAKEITDEAFGKAPTPSKKHASLIATANKMIDKGDRAADLMARGYAPLSRFGTYTLDVVDADGERVYFGLFESRFEADRMAKQMAAEYPGSTVEQGTLSEESYKLFAGVSPETVALFGDMLGLEDNGAYQDYLKLAKSTRSAMKRLIERKGIAGFSEDAGRVLAGFVYSNARQTSQNLHTGEMVQAANDIPKGMGELKDKATQLVEYIKHPQEEAQKIRGLLFAQYIGGSIASAMVNMTQPLTMTLPWLTQFGGLSKASKQMAAAVKDATRKTTGDKALDAALKRGEEDGTVSPQEVHDLMRQAQGKGALKSGDGTKLGNAAATAQNAVSRIGFGWGKLFSSAEQFNRRATFIAAYRTAVEQGMKNPDAFARRAIHETQGVYNKGNKPDWARGALGSTLFTFKQYSIAYVEMLHRMATTGEPGSPERAAGRRGALYALAVLMLLSGLGGMPGADDLDDIISGLMQSLGYNFDSKAKRKAFLAEYLGDGAAQFMERGVSGLAGVPIDISGRMGLGNLIPATGLLTKKADHTSDVAELLGPAGDLAKRAFQAGGKLIEGDVLGNHGAIATAAPKAVQNLFQAADMADKGMYRDQTGKKVMETGPGDALAKALGFQPNDVKRAQDANWQVQQMKDLNRIKESEIASRWAIGLFEKNPEKIQSARDDLATWNADNPDAQIRINFAQIRKRVQDMNMTKAERIAKTTPAELRARVRNELALQ